MNYYYQVWKFLNFTSSTVKEVGEKFTDIVLRAPSAISPITSLIFAS